MFWHAGTGIGVSLMMRRKEAGEQMMYKKVEDYVKIHNMLEQKDKVIAGVSGGADSVCLLYVLLELKKKYSLEIRAVHVNHCLREGAADEDEAYVRKLCAGMEVPLEVYRIDVVHLAKEEGMSSEEAGRAARRKAFEEEADKMGGAKIALAHHKNDNVETLLLNIARGTGLKGLGGIRPAAGRYIHPLLGVSREEIEEFLKKNQLSYCMDATNYEDTYTRNRIRNHMIPYMEQKINPRFTDHACSMMEQMGKLWDHIAGEVCMAEKTAVVYREDQGKKEALIQKAVFEKIPEALRPYLLHRVMEKVAGSQKDLAGIHLEQTEELFRKQTGRKLDLPYQMCARRCYEGVEISRNDRAGESGGEGAQREQSDGRLTRKADRVKMRVLGRKEMHEEQDVTIFQTPYTKWFDYDIIKNSVTIRTRRPGDYITIDRKGRTQKLKQYFINEKIPQKERDDILLAADGSHILWVIGYRRGCACEVTESTRKILEITIDGGENYGGDN
ncbi:tRNA lysidine(34) synthetase TilS [Mordavella massiliensis]|uniref:tRNA lysidine(34) synthetase TilS n=1 Tax=Mordavella massiliensis TaxID=1871024 RepID=UPI00210E8D17|nr:tRNA lysidine(34) synthetase TilS [Mordavella massiliensis]